MVLMLRKAWLPGWTHPNSGRTVFRGSPAKRPAAIFQAFVDQLYTDNSDSDNIISDIIVFRIIALHANNVKLCRDNNDAALPDKY